MNTEQELKQQIIRYVQLTGKKATPHAVAEGLRNRWDLALDPEEMVAGTGKSAKVRRSKLTGSPTYAEQMNSIIRLMLKEGEIELDQSTLTRRQQPKAKPVGWISFAWTTPALISGHKRVTRREWKDNYAARFQQGDLLHAYDKRPNWGGKAVALIRLTQTPYKHSTGKVPETDWYNEGFAWLQSQGKKVDGMTPKELWQDWKDNPKDMWVVRFEVVELL